MLFFICEYLFAPRGRAWSFRCIHGTHVPAFLPLHFWERVVYVCVCVCVCVYLSYCLCLCVHVFGHDCQFSFVCVCLCIYILNIQRERKEGLAGDCLWVREKERVCVWCIHVFVFVCVCLSESLNNRLVARAVCIHVSCVFLFICVRLSVDVWAHDQFLFSLFASIRERECVRTRERKR
jgi:hypothetical protein